MNGALEGLRVIDLSSNLSGPFGTMQLADMGADVIKVERPGDGDNARNSPPFVGGESAPFMLWNRNKRSIALDLKSAEDRAVLRDLLATADVLVENFRPGTMERLGLGYDDLRLLNPRLIYCSVSGFGQTGPYRSRGGFDLMTQAMSGLMAISGDVDGPPLRLPIPISDLAAALYATIGILAAVEARHRTGEGQRVETSLFEAAVSLCVYEAAGHFAEGGRPERLGQAHRGSSPYQVFRTADGWLTIGGAQQNFWLRLCDILDVPELTQDPRFLDNASRVRNNTVLVELLQARLLTRPNAHWLAELEAAGIPAGQVMSHDEVFADPQMLARDMVVEVEHPAAGRQRTIGSPLKFSQTPTRIARPAPLLGEHTAEVKAELAAFPSQFRS